MEYPRKGRGPHRTYREEFLVSKIVVQVVILFVLRIPLIEHESPIGLSAAVFAHPLIERGEEEILQDRLVIG